jgi:hypothetical protein
MFCSEVRPLPEKSIAALGFFDPPSRGGFDSGHSFAKRLGEEHACFPHRAPDNLKGI